MFSNETTEVISFLSLNVYSQFHYIILYYNTTPNFYSTVSQNKRVEKGIRRKGGGGGRGETGRGGGRGG